MDGSFSPVSSRFATSAPTRSSIRAGDTVTRGATRTSERPNVAASFSSSSRRRPDGSWIRISTIPCRCASASIRDTLERLVPIAAATSACDLPST